MWPWNKHWRDWMLDLPLLRAGPRPQALRFGYEKAGLICHDQPIPWNAEAVVVEALVARLPAGRRLTDFQLRLPGQKAIPGHALRPEEAGSLLAIGFRLSPPRHTVTAELLFKTASLGQLTLPVLDRMEFVKKLAVQMPTLSVRLGHQAVACQTFVSTQCRGLIASTVLASPTSLIPLLDLNLQVEFRAERTGTSCLVPVSLTSSQLAGRQALVNVVPPQFPRRNGSWRATWLLGDEPLASLRVRAISQRQFLRSLQITDAHFVVQTVGGVQLQRQLPALQKGLRLGPCFLVASREPGMAGLCNFTVHAQMADKNAAPRLLEQRVLVTDGPSMVAPGTLDAALADRVAGFELRLKDLSLGVLSLRPAPTATFTGEGAFVMPESYLWSGAAEDELSDRLGKLLDEPGK